VSLASSLRSRLVCSHLYSSHSSRRASFGTTARVAIAAGNPHDRLPAGLDPDTYVPPYYVERKRRQSSFDEHKLDSSLMHELAAGEVAATIRRQANKIPVEHILPEGGIIHASGYVVPAPGDAPEFMADLRERDIAVQTAAVAARVSEDGAIRDITFGVRPRKAKVPYEVVEADGSIRHPSGFTPPTPAHEFSSSAIADEIEEDVTLRLTSGPAARTPWKQGWSFI
jgi:hypothetical protein